MTELNISDRVVSIKNEVWKKVPFYPTVIASSEGRIAALKDNEEYNLINQGPIKTSVGTYLGVCVRHVDKGWMSISVHVLVALAFHGVPDNYGSPLITVNHDDGNKHNNKPNNLEWMSRSENLIHAYRTGLRRDNVPVKVIDHKTNTLTLHYSIAEFSRAHGVTKSRAQTLIEKYGVGGERYQGRYSFEVDRSKTVTPNHEWIRDIVALDYRERKIIIASTTAEVSQLTGVKRGTVLWNLNNNKLNLVNGCVFQYADSQVDWPEFTTEEIATSRERHAKRKPHMEKRFGVLVKDYVTGEVREFSTKLDAATNENIAKGTLAYFLTELPRKLVNGKAYKYKDDPIEFPLYKSEAVMASLGYRKNIEKYYVGTDIETNTTKCYPTIRALALDVGEDPASMAGCFRRAPNRLFKNRYQITQSTEVLDLDNSAQIERSE